MNNLGKIFISHSSLDKDFVRQLVKKIEDAGFNVWLDEHELLAGDRLPEKISEALQRSQVVLLIVSKQSIKSKWLKYELNIASQRMVEGRCRVIPIIIDNSELPSEVVGILYSNCQNSL